MFKQYIKTTSMSFVVMFGMMGMMGLSSCSDDDSPLEPDKPKGEMEKLTPEESKDFLDNSAKTMMNTLNASDQESFIKTASYAYENYADIEFPDKSGDDNERKNPALFLKNLANAVKQGSAHAMAAASYTYVYDYDYREYYGVYEVRGSEWVKTEDSENIVFKFRNYDRSTCILTLEPSKEFSDIDWENEYDDYYSETEEYYVKIPKTVKVTLVSGTKTLVNGTVNTSVSKTAHTVSADANITVENINAQCQINGTDTKVDAAFATTVGGKLFVKGNTSINGTHLCDVDFFRNNDIESEDLYNYFKSGTANANAMDLVQIDAKAEFTREFCAILDRSYYNYDYDTETEAETAIANDVKLYNQYISANVRYNNTKTVQAKLKFDYEHESYYRGWEYYIIPLIQFEGDGSTYTFEEYFEKGFGSVENQWNSLVRSYKSIWNSVLK